MGWVCSPLSWFRMSFSSPSSSPRGDSDPDPFIPHTESLALAEALGRKEKVRLEILRLFRHVQSELPDTDLRNVVKVYLPEGWKIYRLIFDLLRQRR